jgi:hypothetical protein
VGESVTSDTGRNGRSNDAALRVPGKPPRVNESDEEIIASFAPRRQSLELAKSMKIDKSDEYVLESYAVREREWTFAKEKPEGTPRLGPPRPIGNRLTRGSAPIGQQEIWRCDHVGRFKADRAVFRSECAHDVQCTQELTRDPQRTRRSRCSIG